MIAQLSIHISNILRLLVVSEIFFSVGFLLYRLWLRRKKKEYQRYLEQMAISLVLYSIFAAVSLLVRYNHSISWRTPFVFVISTVSILAVVREGTRKMHDVEGRSDERRQKVNN